MIKIPEIGQERLFTLVVKATVIDKSDAHGACVELAIEQRDFATYEHRTVWLDADEISAVNPAELACQIVENGGPYQIYDGCVHVPQSQWNEIQAELARLRHVEETRG